MTAPAPSDRMLLLAEVCLLTRLSDETLQRLEDQDRFPKRVKITGKQIGWRADEVERWVKDRKGSYLRKPFR